MMTVGSLFSGIGGLDLGFERAGMTVAWQCEIDKAASTVLARHWPDVPNMGDVRDVGHSTPSVDVVVGGFPCQDVSVAGRRAGLDGERSGLWHEFRRIVGDLRPRWVVVENVPGLLSSNGGRDFAVILRGLVECGYGVAWRVLDAQYFGLPQRRRRVFLVGSFGNGRAAQVLFERESLPGDTPPRRETGARVARALAASSVSSGDRYDPNGEEYVVTPFTDISDALFAAMGTKWNGNAAAFNGSQYVAHTLRAEGADASEDGTGRGTSIVPIAFPERLSGTQCASEAGLSSVLQSRNPTAVAYPDEETRRQGDGESFAFDLRGREGGAMPEGPHATANLRAGSGGSSRSYVAQKAESEEQRAESSDAFAFHENQRGELTVNDTAGSLKVGGGKPGPGYPAVAFQPGNLARGAGSAPSMDVFPTLKSDHGRGKSDQDPHVACQEPQAYTLHGSREGTQAVASATDTAIQNSSTTVALQIPEVADTLRSGSSSAKAHGKVNGTDRMTLIPSAASQWRVRRLTPEECEMLQGFPVGYTLIPGTSSKKRKGEDLSATIDYLISLGLPRPDAEVLAHSPDGPRYKALGNSWAVPVARWIARRIDACAKALSRQ